MNSKAMLLANPDLVLALPGGTGTANMVRRTKSANLAIQLVGN